MNCHSQVRKDSALLLPLFQSIADEKQPLEWVRVHNMPDFVYFDHSAHIASGVGCATCHGRVDQMPEVRQVQPMSMSWCVDCHKAPDKHLRTADQVTNMDWDWGKATAQAKRDGNGRLHNLTNGRVVNPPLHCSGCHR
jgi:hypothetical protein